jgi:hypothetical protein
MKLKEKRVSEGRKGGETDGSLLFVYKDVKGLDNIFELLSNGLLLLWALSTMLIRVVQQGQALVGTPHLSGGGGPVDAEDAVVVLSGVDFTVQADGLLTVTKAIFGVAGLLGALLLGFVGRPLAARPLSLTLVLHFPARVSEGNKEQ